MNLYLIRHGECEGVEKPDEERALTTEGCKAIEKIAAHVTTLAVPPTKLFVSPLYRAVQTAEFFQKHWDVAIEEKDWLRPSIPPGDVLAALQGYTESDCALVGHLPNLGYVLGCLVWGTSPKEVVIPKGGVAYLTVPTWEAGTAKLRWLLTPDVVA